MFYQNFSSPQAKRYAIITHPTAFSPMGKGGGGSVPTQEKKQKKTYGLRKSGNIRKILKFRRMIA